MVKYLLIILLLTIKLWCFFLPIQSSYTWDSEEKILFYGKEHPIWYADLLFSLLLVGQAMFRKYIGSGIRIVNPILALIFAFLWFVIYAFSTIGLEFVPSAEPAFYLLLASFIASVLMAFYLSFENQETKGRLVFSIEKHIMSVLMALILLSGILPVQRGITDNMPDVITIYGYQHAQYYTYLILVTILFAVILFRQYLVWIRFLVIYFSVITILAFFLIGYKNEIFRFTREDVWLLSGGYLQLITSVTLAIYANYIAFRPTRN